MAASDARTLAHRLAARDDAALAALFAARRVSPTARWDDAFDAAEDLLDPASLARAFVELTAHEAAALASAVETGAAAAGPARDALVALALLDDDGRPWDATAAAFRAAVPVSSAGASAAGSEVSAGASAAGASVVASAAGASVEASVTEAFIVASAAGSDSSPVSDDAPGGRDAVEAERAFTASASLADVLQAALAAPLGRIGAGTLGAVDRRRLVDAGAVPDAEAADDLVAIAGRAGLLAAEERAWLVTEEGLRWLSTSTRDRWVSVARRLVDTLPRALRGADGGWIPLREWPAAYPFDIAWPDRAARIAALLHRWAITDATGAPPSWTADAAAGGGIDADALARHLPPEVDRVFLQNDLTAIAPGSLAPHLDMRLRGMARRESRAQASSYRFTAESLADALTAGETAASLRSFLEELSLTGLPQPLAYEIERTAGRHGALRVGPDETGRTRITSDDTALLRTIAVDQALRPLGLVPDGDALVSRSGPDTAFWMIADARYPIVAVDVDGRRRTLARHRLAGAPATPPPPVEVYAELLARVRAAQAGDADAAWLERELDQAVKARATIVVAVQLPGGEEREFTIEATGLGGGRLRGRDRHVDVERTLPVASITRVSAP